MWPQPRRDHERCPQDSAIVTVPLLATASDVNHVHRQHGSTSFFKTCFNGINALSGVGILSITHALASGGWISLVIFFLIAGCTCYTGLLIQRCMDMDHNINTYPDIGARAFGPKGRALVSIAMNVELYLVATGFLILEGDNLHSLFPHVKFKIVSMTMGGKQGFILIIGLILLLFTVLLDNMSVLAYLSAGGVISSLILICAIFWDGAFDGIGFKQQGVILNPTGIPTAVSLYAFCYCAHPVFPTLYTSMSNQKEFSKVLLVSFSVCTMGYASMAIMGYVMFGSSAESQITLNLPTKNLSSKVAIYTTIVTPLTKYSLMMTPIVSAIESSLQFNSMNMVHVLITKVCLVLSTIVVALTIPFFGYLMSLVGALLSVTASVILPCLCFLKISGFYKTIRLETISLWSIVLMGVIILVVGTYVALQEIIQSLLK